MKTWLMLAGALACAVFPARAEIKAKHFSANAKWMLHVDLKALNGAPMGQFIRQAIDENAKRGLASFQQLSGINLTNDVDSLVVYGTEQGKTGTVMVVYGRFDVAKVTAVVGGAKEYQNKVMGDRSLLSWSDKGRRTNLCFVDPTLAVLSQDEQAVRDAVARIDGQSAGMGEDGPFSRVLSHTKNRFLAVQASDVSALARVNPQVQMFKQAEAVLLEVGQLTGANGLDCSLAIKARTQEMAQQFSQAAQGIQALLQLQASQNPDAAALAQNVKVDLQGDVVSVSLALAEERIRKMISVRMEQQKAAAEARRAARQAKRGAAAADAEAEPAGGEKRNPRPAFE